MRDEQERLLAEFPDARDELLRAKTGLTAEQILEARKVGRRPDLEIETADGVIAWIDALLPGRGRASLAKWKRRSLGKDGAAYLHKDGKLSVIVSGAYLPDPGSRDGTDRRWLHVSVAHTDRLPTWDELREVKDCFVGDGYAYQVFPPRRHFVNLHPFCLHLWHCVDVPEGQALPEFTRGLPTL